MSATANPNGLRHPVAGLLLSGLCLLVWLAFGASVTAAQTSVTLYVDPSGTATTGCTQTSPCGSVQEGINAADGYTNSDVTVEVAAGTYHEAVTTDVPSGDALSIEGTGADSTTVDAGGQGSVFAIEAGSAGTDTGSVTISGLTITGGTSVFGPSLAVCSNGYGGGVCAWGGPVTLTNDTISNNTAEYSGGGVYGADTLTNDTITGNTAMNGDGGGVWGANTLTGDTITGNTATNGNGGGVYAAGTLTNDTITNNSATNGSGGGVANPYDATLSHDTLSGNNAGGAGGGLANGDIGDSNPSGATVTVADTTLSGNTGGFGGGVGNLGTATITNTTLSGNSGGFGGGAENQGTATLTDDTLSGNTTWGGSIAGGGGIYNEQGTATLTNDTLTGNHTDGVGGGAVLNAASITLTDDTLSNNTDLVGSGGISNVQGTVTLADSILSASPCGATITDGGYNVESDDSCGLNHADNVVNSSTINLGPLASNGSAGPETMAIGPDSSAHEEVPASACTITTDERGLARPGANGTSCDAGAFEYQEPPVPTSTSVLCSPASVALGESTTCTATVSDTSSSPVAPTGSVSFTSDSTGSFSSGGTCVLSASGSQATCSVSYTPTATGSGTQTITANYIPTDHHAKSRGTFALTVNDADLALHNVPANITTDATGPSGASVSYTTPTASDEGGQSPPVTCVPASGSTFKIGTTTVTCSATASDGDDANSPVSAHFTVTVNGALAQLQELLSYVQALPRGTSLTDKVQAAISYIQAGDTTDTCSELTATINEARAQAGKTLSTTQANTVITDARQIRTVIRC